MNNKDELLKRYSKSLDHIGVKNLSALPTDIKDEIKKIHSLEQKVKLFEEIELSLNRQGLI